MNARCKFALLMIALAVCLGGAGCAMIDESGGSLFGAASDKKNAGNIGPACYVEFYKGREMIARRTVPLTGPSDVNDVFKKAKVLSRFDRVNAHLIRRGSQRMRIQLTKHKVDPLFNYAVHPGDRIVVQEDPTTFFDDALDSVSGPLARNFGSK